MAETKMIYVPEDLVDDARIFFDQYTLATAVYCAYANTLKRRKSTQVCRYCKRNSSHAKFSTQAHAIPRFTGNTEYFAIDECDECNQLFSIYESDLAHFLGVSRTLYDMKGRRGVPKFKSWEEDAVTVQNEGSDEAGKIASVVVRSESLSKEVMKVDLDKQCIEITLTKGDYVPVNVYKSLVKMGMAIMPEDELVHFDLAMKYLTEKDFHKCLQGLAVAYIQQTEYWYKKPAAYLFRKKDASAVQPTYIFTIHLNNFFIQVVLPLYRPDFAMYVKPTEVPVRFAPVFVTIQPTGLFRRTAACKIDLQSDEVRKGETETFIAEFTYKDGEGDNVTPIIPESMKKMAVEKIVAVRIFFGGNDQRDRDTGV